MEKQWVNLNKKPTDLSIENILRNRGIKNLKHFLNPLPSDFIPLSKLKRIFEAAEIIIKGIKENKKFTIFYDCDLDGTAAGTIMRKYLLNFTPNVDIAYSIGKEHGLSSINLDNIIQNTDILIAVDSSTGNHKERDYLKQNGVEVIIYDHHDEPNNQNVCIVNSQFEDYPNKQLSGAGVVWKGCLAIDSLMKTKYALNYVDLAAAGILADVMDVGESYMENRLIITMGFKHLVNVGLKTAIGTYDFNSTSILFSVAPLVNAAIRMRENKIAIDFLFEEEKKQSKKLLKKLKEIKEKQNKLVDISMINLEFQMKQNNSENKKVSFGFVENKGIAGVIATKVCSKFDKPAIVLSYPNPAKDFDKYIGSLRSNIDFKTIVNNTKLAKSQGHERAAGIEIKKENLEKLLDTLEQKLKNKEFKKVDKFDLLIKAEFLTLNLIKQIEKINRLTGKNFQPINVVLENVVPVDFTIMIKKHIKFNFRDIEFVYWNSIDKIQDFKTTCSGLYRSLSVMGIPQVSYFRGREKKQIMIQDYKDVKDNFEFLKGYTTGDIL